MSDSLFTRVGRALYGEGFIPSLARALDVNERTVQRWVSGSAYPPHGVWDELGALLEKRHHTQTTDLLREALHWLEDHAGWEYGFSVDELENLKARMREHLLGLEIKGQQGDQQ